MRGGWSRLENLPGDEKLRKEKLPLKLEWQSCLTYFLDVEQIADKVGSWLSPAAIGMVDNSKVSLILTPKHSCPSSVPTGYGAARRQFGIPSTFGLCCVWQKLPGITAVL